MSLVVIIGTAGWTVADAGVGSASSTDDSAKWTVMVYMSGDNNLEKYVVKDLEDELGGAGSNSDVQIVALADRGPGYDKSRGDWQTTKLFHVTKGMTANSKSAVADWGEQDLGDKHTLTKFVKWTKNAYPADHYALYFWGHGWSWHPGWVLKDVTDDDTLDSDEMQSAMPAIGPLDVVGYDGCNMASIEIMKLWQGHAAAVSSSQEWVGWDGLEYDVFLKKLKRHPHMSPENLAIASSKSTVTDKTWSTVALDRRFGKLVTAVDEWSMALKGGLKENKKSYHRAFERTRSYWEAPMDKDLYALAKQINARVSDPKIRRAGHAVMDAVSAAVLYEHHASSKSGSHGITIYAPGSPKQKTDNRYYQRLAFARDTHWDEFLNAFLS